MELKLGYLHYESGVHYFVPDGITSELGRFNDPTFRTGICYTADYAYIAAAESLGRVYQSNPAKFTIGLPFLEAAQIYTLETTRSTKTIDLPKLLGILRITVDTAMDDDYSMTQNITDWAANTPSLEYDGITYLSRHCGGMCTAFWTRKGATDPLKSVKNSNVVDYIDDDQVNFPASWIGKHDDISGLEIVSKTLRYSVK